MSTALTTEASPAAPAAPATSLAPVLASNRAAAIRGWIAGGSVYLAGSLNRSVLGVAAIAAVNRFGISPGQLSVFVILQLGIYAAMQVPVGVLVDAFGSRRLLLLASAIIGVAGLGFAFAPNYPTALAARGLLGCGDAMTYISVLRFAGASFSSRRFPQVVSLTSMFGFSATILATVPLAFLLHATGWQTTFTVTAMVPVIAGIAVAVAMPRSMPVSTASTASPTRRASHSTTMAAVRKAWRTPATRLGFWVHFSCMSTGTVFAVLWGLPYLVSSGFSTEHASDLLLVCVLVGVTVSLTLGAVVAARPILRVPIAFGSCVVTVAAWLPLLAFGGDHPPRAVVVLLVTIMAAGPPVSSVAFLLVRDYNRPEIGGTATGVVNCAGFLATIVGCATFGGVLELIGNTSAGAFRVAFAATVAIQALGAIRIATWWRRVRAELLIELELGHRVPVVVVRHPWDTPREARLVPNSKAASTAGVDLAQ